MGNILTTPNEESQSMLHGGGGNRKPTLSSSSAAANGKRAPIFVDDLKAEPAPWSQEGICTSIQRMIGWLPDSQTEGFKQQQLFPFFTRRSSKAVNVLGGPRMEAIVTIQQFYRRFSRLRKWHVVANQMLELARQQIELRRALESEEMTLLKFRQIMMAGFAASKVSISGKLKNIQLQLVLNSDKEECYLTWKPSRKRNPRIHLHDIQEVVPVLQSGNKHAPRLATKVSHRRGLIIVTKSHHRGRVILELGSKRERNLLLHGFNRLLEELNQVEPQLDTVGAIRKRLPRRRSVVDFFDPDSRPSSQSTQDENNMNKENVDSQTSSKCPSIVTDSKRPSASIEHFYQTRFDESTTRHSSKPNM